MRGLLLSLTLATLVASAAPAPVLAATRMTVPAIAATSHLQAPAKDVNVDINVNHGHAWYRSPVWIAIAVLGVVVLLLLIALVVRGGGGGTTIIRE